VAAFTFTALDTFGSEQKGVMEADSSRQVRQLLRDQGLSPLQILPAARQDLNAKRSLTLFDSRSLKTAELALFTRQLATLLQSGLPLEQSLGAIAKQAEQAKVSSIIMGVRSKVLEGFTLARAMAEYPKAFPLLYRATVASGEHAGHIDGVLERLADHTENENAAKQKVMLAMLYPALLLLTAVSIVLGLMIFVVPGVIEVFSDQGQQLPLMTRILVGFSDLLSNHGGKLFLAVIIIVSGFRYLLSQPAFRMQWDKRLLRVPLLGKLLLGIDTARIAGTLHILNASGVPLVEAMKIATDVLGNNWLKAQMQKITQQVQEGSSLFRALEHSGSFPPMMVHMIASGEHSGELGTMLGRIATHQQRELDTKISAMIGILEPLMLLFMGGTVLFIVLAILLPILNMNTLLTN
jgi:general secretion pathway protein F